MSTPSLLAILGPTASGKSSLAITIAQKYNGEIISVDSRQIYRGMDIGTGKVFRDSVFPLSLDKERVGARLSEGQYISESIPHHLLDIAEPNDTYNVTDFVRDAHRTITDIQSRGKLPILCGGTGFWAQALLTGQTFPAVPPDPALREKLARLTPQELFAQLEQLNPERAQTIDRHNPVRLIRAIEIASARIKNLESRIKRNTNSEIESESEKHDSKFFILNSAFIIALNPPMETLREKIKIRLDERFNQGMIKEVRQLHDQGVSWERLEAFGLEYRWIARYLQNRIDGPTMREKLYFDIVHYAKRQLTWLRRWERQGTTIHWFITGDEALQAVKFILEKIK